MSKCILVTGVAGFIGSNLTVALLNRGDTVIGLDNLNDYYNPSRKQSNLDELQNISKSPKFFKFIRGDIRDQTLLNSIFSNNSFDVVIHLAAMAGVRASIEDPHLYYDVNVDGTLNILEAARKHDVNNLIFASTSSVYGNIQQRPFVESAPCDHPLAPYPASKRAAEILGYTYHYLYGINFVALRFFTVYGPRGRPDMMAYKVLDNIFFGKKVVLYNNGQMYRDWTYIDDIVSGILAAIDQKQIGYEVINLGCGKPILLKDFVDIIQELTGRTAKLIPKPIVKADIQYSFADIKKAQEYLGYEPKIMIREGLQSFWEWYRKAILVSSE